MKNDDFIILELNFDDGETPADTDMFSGVLSVESSLERMVSRRTARPAEIADVKLETMTDKDAADINRDPKRIALRDMEISLIEPASTALADGGEAEAAPSAGPTWGVNEVLGGDPADVTGEDVKVAVIDTGIVKDHPAFAGLDIDTEDFTDTIDTDENGHGTHCAGTIFGREMNGTRIGVAPGVTEVYVAKVLNKFGRGKSSWLIKALKWAHFNDVNIASISIGFDFPRMRERLVKNDEPPEIATSKALKSYRDNLKAFDLCARGLNAAALEFPGTVIVAASGNESRRADNPDFVVDVTVPAAANDEILSVGALEKTALGLDVAAFSNINARLSAPGVDVWSAALDGGLRPDSGTSMACPHVAGIAALWWQWVVDNEGRASARRVRELLSARCSKNGIVSWNMVDHGVGCVQAPQIDQP